jgi:hypothetical protein
MPIPSARRLINVQGAPTFSEAWASDDAAWDQNPLPWAWYTAPQRAVLPNDGIMGSRFYRLGATSGTGHATWAQELATFDQTQPATFAYRFRMTWGGGGYDWLGLGVLYNGEAIYDGLTSEAYSLGAGNLGMYGLSVGPGSFASGDVVDVEGRWNPSAWSLGYRVKVNGGAWSSWVDRVNGAHTVAVANLGGGSSLLWPFTLYFFLDSTQGPTTLDIGPVSVTGVPLWGASDYVGFSPSAGWTLNGAAYISGDDASKVLGGLTGMESTAKEFIDHNGFLASNGSFPHSGSSITASWSAQSPIIGVPQGCRYDYLEFHAYNEGGRLKVYVRDAATGLLIPDSVVAGNSAGLMSSAASPTAAHRATSTSGYVGRKTTKLLCNSPGPQRVSLKAIPYGQEVYLDVQGSTLSADGTYLNQPRLGGAWIASINALDAGASFPGGGVMRISGPRTVGSTVTVVPR